MKLYFTYLEENCYPLSYWKEYKKEFGLSDLRLFEAKMEIGNGYFFCTQFAEIGTAKESCGKQCRIYEPRNGKNGRCRFSSNCYIPTDKIKII